MSKLASPVTPLKPWSTKGTGGVGVTAYQKHIVAQRAREILESDDYQRSLHERIVNNKLSPAMEVTLWHYAYGKPAETINMNVQPAQDLQNMSVEELQAEARRLADQLEEAAAVEATIPVEFKRTA